MTPTNGEAASAPPAFEVEYACGNCGGQWADEYPVRTEVKTARGRVHVFSRDCDAMAGQCGDCCGPVQCPTCELYGHVEIADRRPVEEGDDGE